MTRARQVANFDPALFAADEVSGDKVSGGTIGAGVIGASVTGGAGLTGSTSLGTVTAGNLSNTAIVYPTGHVIKSGIKRYSGSDLTISSTNIHAACDFMQITCSVGNTILFGTTLNCIIVCDGNTTNVQSASIRLYQHTSAVSQSETVLGTLTGVFRGGRKRRTTDTFELDPNYPTFSPTSSFISTATTHYLGVGFICETINNNVVMKFDDGQKLIIWYQELEGDVEDGAY